MNIKENNDFIFKQFIDLAKSLALILGNQHEVIVHNFTDLQKSVVFVSGNLTNREIGSSITEFLLKKIRRGETKENIENLKLKMKNGLILRSSTIFIHNENGDTIGSLGININLTNIIEMNSILNSYLINENDEEHEEKIMGTIKDIFEKIIKKHIKDFEKPVSHMSREEKTRIIKKLDHAGVFLVKGGIERIAYELNISRYTVYNYLNSVENNADI